MPHKKVLEDPIVQEFHFDWAFPSDESDEKSLCVLVGRMRNVVVGSSARSDSARKKVGLLRLLIEVITLLLDGLTYQR